MTHLWVRAEPRENEERVGVTPEGVAQLRAAGLRVTVEDSPSRAIPLDGYVDAGAEIAPAGSWVAAPQEAVIFGLKELPEDGTPLHHRHIMFGHAYKGQSGARAFLDRFKSGGGALYDLEYLVDEQGRRVAAFGYWAGYAGAALALKCWTAQQRGGLCGAVGVYDSSTRLVADLRAELIAASAARPTVLIIGALGRVGHGAADLCQAMGLSITKWDMKETASGGPFPEILAHDIFLNCILARPNTPLFVPQGSQTAARNLSVIGDIACDPNSPYNPIPIYDRATTWSAPALRLHAAPPLDVTAIDNLPSLLPVESSEDFAAQLLPSLLALTDIDAGVWGRARQTFDAHL